MASDRIKRDDIVEGKVLDLGRDYAKSLQAAIDKNDEWLKSFAPIKAAAIEFSNISNQFKVTKNQQEFLEIKKKEEQATIAATNALKAEQQLLVSIEKTKQANLATEKKTLELQAKELDITNKQLSITAKEEQAQKRKIKLSAQERVELQQRNLQAKRLAQISSSLSTAYERESARLVLLTRNYKGAAIQYGVNSKEARKLQRELDELRAKLFTVDKAAGNFQRNVGNYPRSFGGAIKSINSLANAAGLLGGAFLAIQTARDAARTIIEFDRQLIAVRKTTNLTKEETKAFGKEVVDLGLKLKGISIQGLLKSSEIAGQLGIRGSNNILKFSKTLEQLKLTSDIVGDESARNFAKFIEVSSDSVENADRLGSVITQLGNNFATTESQILNNTTEIQKGISIYKASAQSVIGLGAATNALGNEAEVSAGGLQKAFKVLNDGATTGKNLEKILKLTGQTAAEFRKEFAENSVETFRKFVKGLSDSDKEGKNLSNTLTELGLTNLRTTRVVGSLAKNYETLEEALNQANSEYEKNTALTKEADQAAESLEANIADLSDSWDALVLSVESGDGALSKGFKTVVTFLSNALKGLRLLNLSQKEYNESLTSNIADNIYKDTLDAIQEAGDAGKELAIQEADRSRDKIDQINDEIKALQERNKELKEVSNFGTGLRKSLSLISVGIISKESPEIKKNNERIKELSGSLGFYQGTLKATEEAISFTDDALDKNNKTVEDATELSEAQRKAEEKANKERERANAALLKRRELERNNKFKLESFNIKELIKEQDAIIKNDKEFFLKRQEAIKKQYELELDLALISARNKFDLEKNFTDKEIDALLTKSKVSKDTLKKVGDEELLIIAEYQAKKKELTTQKEESEDSIEIERIKTEAETAAAIQEIKLNNELEAENKAFLAKEGIYQDQLKAVENYEKRIAEIKEKYALQALAKQIEALEILKNQTALGSDERIEAERKLAEAKKAYSDLSVKIVSDNTEKEIELNKERVEKILELSGELASTLVSIGNSIYESRIQDIDDEIEKNDERYQRILDDEQLSAENRLAIEKQQEKKREELEKKRRQEQRKQAILNKAFNVAEIIANNAVAISKVLGQTGIFGIAASIPVAALGALQLAAALATKIPSYAKGTKDHPGGPALVGEGKKNGQFVPEVVSEPGKKPYIVDRPTILDLPKHTKVTPSLEEYEQLMRASILASVDINNNKLNTFQAKVSVNNNYDGIIKKLDSVENAIKKQPKQPVHFHERKIDINHAIWASKNKRWHG